MARTRLHLHSILAPILVALVISACGGDSPPDEMEDDPAPAPPVEASPSPMDTVSHVTVELPEMNDSGVSGEAMAMHADDAVVVILEMEGLPEEREYDAHIHGGSCARPGMVRVPLNPVVGLADGTGTSTTTLEADEVFRDEPAFIMVHGEGGTPIACGDLVHPGRR